MEENQNNFPQGVTPPSENAVMVLGADGKYYWMIPTEDTPAPPQQQVFGDYDTTGQVPPQPVYQPSYIRPVVTVKPPIPYGFTEKTYNERKAIRRQALALGFAFFSIEIVPYILNFLFGYILTPLFKFDGFITENILNGSVYDEIVQICFSFLAFTVPFIIFSKCVGKQQIAEISGFNRVEKGLGLVMFFFGIAFCGFAQVATDVTATFFGQFFTYEVPHYESAGGVVGIILSVISTAITPALAEEFACRGIALGSLRKYGDGFALIVSSLLFAFMHGNFQQIPFAFLVGLILGYIRIKSGSIWICCAVHGFNNLLSVIYEALQKYWITDMQTETLYLTVITVCMLLGFVALFMVSDKKDLFRFEKSSLECTGNEKYKWFFTSPVIILYFAETLLESAVYFLPSGTLNF